MWTKLFRKRFHSGTGTTANFFIEALGKIKHRIDGAVASSEATASRLRSVGIDVLDLGLASAAKVNGVAASSAADRELVAKTLADHEARLIQLEQKNNPA